MFRMDWKLNRKTAGVRHRRAEGGEVHRGGLTMRYDMKPQGVCARQISFDLDGNVVTNVVFTNGCNGNLKAIGKLVNGMTVEQIEGYLLGNQCGMKGTSCADQLAKCVRQAYEQSK